MTDEDGTITAFSSTMMIFEEESSTNEDSIVVDPGFDLNLFPEFYDLAFDGVEELPGSEDQTELDRYLTYEDFKIDVRALIEKYNLTAAIMQS